jgi:nucleoside-diphosphate-sugar epimerase
MPTILDHKDDYLLVVGGTGFIGQWVVKAAIKRGYKVGVLSSTHLQTLKKLRGVDYLKANLLDKKELLIELQSHRITHVVNLSGKIHHSSYLEGGRAILETHFIGVLNLVEVLDWKSLKCFIQVGSSDEYGNNQSPQNEKQNEDPISSYAVGKASATKFLQMLHKTEGFPVVITRLFLVYGPGQNKYRFLPQIITECLNNKVFPTSLGEQLRDFCYVEDISEGLLKILETSNFFGEIFNLASGKPISIRKVTEQIITIIGSGKAKIGSLPYRKCENMSLYADISKANELLLWMPKINLKDGLNKTISFYREDL